MGKGDMDLKMQILARGQQALAVLHSVEEKITSINKRTGDLAHVAGRTFGVVGSVVGAAFRPLKWAAGAALGLAAALAAVGVSAIHAAGEDQALIERLATLYGSAEKARKKFADIEKMSRSSLFDPSQIVDATMVLEQFGLGGSRTLGIVARAAKAAHVPIESLALELGALRARGLKMYGIEMSEKDDHVTFRFRDRMQKLRQIVVSGADEARKALLGIFDIKFGGRQAEGMETLIAGLKHTIHQAWGAIGDKLLPIAEKFVGNIRDRLSNLIDSGKLGDLGSVIADKIQTAWDYGRAVVEKAQDVIAAIQGEPGKQAKIVREIFATVGEMIVIGLVNYLRVMGHIFAGIGKLIAGAFLEDMLQLPGMNLARSAIGANRAKEMTGAEATAAGIPQDIVDRLGLLKAGLLTDKQRSMLSTDFLHWSKNNPESAAKLSSATAARFWASGISEVHDAIPAITRETLGAYEQKLRELEARISTIAGPSGPSIEDRVLSYQWGRKLDVLEAAHVRPDVITFGSGGLNKQGRYNNVEERVVPAGRFHVGQDLPGGATVINIQQLTIRADSTEKIRNDILKAAGQSWMVPAMTQ